MAKLRDGPKLFGVVETASVTFMSGYQKTV